MPREERRRRVRSDEKYRSRELLARADAMTVIVDRQLERLKVAAEQYRQRFDNEGSRHA